MRCDELVSFTRGKYSSLYIPFKSAPAQNALPAPVKIPTFNDGSSSRNVHTASNSRCPSKFMQLRSRGRFSVTRRTFGAGYSRVQYFVLGGVSVNFGFQFMGAILIRQSGEIRLCRETGEESSRES
jgi:hypothetical protein